jgi:hypothetical protein
VIRSKAYTTEGTTSVEPCQVVSFNESLSMNKATCRTPVPMSTASACPAERAAAVLLACRRVNEVPAAKEPFFAACHHESTNEVNANRSVGEVLSARLRRMTSLVGRSGKRHAGRATLEGP